MKAKITIVDDKGDTFEGFATLSKVDGNQIKQEKPVINSWFKPNSTVSKVIDLISEGFFDQNRTITDIVTKLESKDYHFKASDLTLPLRKIVRKGLLSRHKNETTDKKSTKWSYMKANK